MPCNLQRPPSISLLGGFAMLQTVQVPETGEPVLAARLPDDTCHLRAGNITGNIRRCPLVSRWLRLDAYPQRFARVWNLMDGGHSFRGFESHSLRHLDFQELM